MENITSETSNTNNSLAEIILSMLDQIRSNPLFAKDYAEGEICFREGKCFVLSYSSNLFEVIIEYSNEQDKLVLLQTSNDSIIPFEKEQQAEWDSDAIAALLLLESEMLIFKPKHFSVHKKYSRKGMIYRVLGERKRKAHKEQYRIEFADNIYGDHRVYTDKGKRYKVFLRDFENETGYSDSLDAKVNKLGTTKHVMAVFDQLKTDRKLFKKLSKNLPFIEIYLDPLNNYRISKLSDDSFPEDLQQLLNQFFGSQNYIEDNQVKNFLPFLEKVADYEQIVVRPEVFSKIDKEYAKDMLIWLKSQFEIPYDQIDADLYLYQKQAVEFFTFREGGILADEMGLGKTLQSIGIAIAKKTILGFKKTLIVCPASLKNQWKKEIEKFSHETAFIIGGTPDQRAVQYLQTDHHFLIVNYESVLRDSIAISKAGIDFLILDEAQRFKNFETKTSSAIKRIQKKHVLVLTGTPIENRISDLFSLMQVVDEEFLGPLWEFSYQYCLFDHEKTNKINGYYNLKELNQFLKPILLRREKRKVLEQLPNINQVNVTVKLSALQAEYHAGYASGVSKILRKKFLTPADQTRLYQLLASMRMVCNSTYLLDTETNDSTKLIELEHVLIEKLDVLNSNKKIIIFSEWLKSHKLIGEILRKHDLRYIEFNGKVPVKKRGELIKKFEGDPTCKFFLSTESGGSGLNLQVADTLINFELPWNPAKKNQRIGRIDRLGQKNKDLTVINFVTLDSIETKIASGLQLKQNLFDGVLNESNELNYVDFSEKGKSQFLDDLKSMIDDFEAGGKVERETIQPDIIEQEESLISMIPTDIGEDGLENKSTDEIIVQQEEIEEVDVEESTSTPPVQKTTQSPSTQQLEEVLNQGMGFFAGLYKMATGEDMASEEQKIEVNNDTGEVTMKFKLPGF